MAVILGPSAPKQHSVNDRINKDLYSLSYTSVDEVVASITTYGRGAMLAKMDIKQAYRNISIHSSDKIYLGMQWNSSIYVDMVLPF